MSYSAITQTFTGQPARTINCNPCGLQFAIPASLYTSWDAKDRAIFCPGCGSNLYPSGKSEAEKLKEKLVAVEARAAENARWAEQRIAAERTAARGSAIAAGCAKAKLERAMKRLGAGVCPCCNRTFSQLSRHMKSKHPELAP